AVIRGSNPCAATKKKARLLKKRESFLYAQLATKALEALDNKEQRGLRSEGVLEVRRASKRSCDAGRQRQ
ncbi:MAG: hypothetical protein Q4E64_09880, partial [Phascolarctobacterium sp.]|uniref:hypothetical protein n=1 Tax=Phascolarctobacterium sp. TaxID=2049039 RepID=UPI0026DBF607